MSTAVSLAELGIHRVPCPVPFLAAGGPANVYLIEEADGGVALFDSGLGSPEGEAAVREGFRSLGYSFGDVRRIYLSHGHIDHYGLARTVSEESGAPVFIHEGDRMKVEEPGAEWRESRKAYSEYMRLLGVSAEDVAKVEKHHDWVMTMARPIEHTKPVREGDTLQFKHFSATVQHCPGHTPGLTCLYVEEHRLLFSDDHLLERVSPNPLIDIGPEGPDNKFRALSSYLRTLERTRATPIDVVLPGHNEPFREPNRIIDSLLHFYSIRQRRVLERFEAGPATAMEVLAHVFPRMGKRDLNLTTSEIVGHLEVLEDRGVLRRLPAAPIFQWELTGVCANHSAA